MAVSRTRLTDYRCSLSLTRNPDVVCTKFQTTALINLGDTTQPSYETRKFRMLFFIVARSILK